MALLEEISTRLSSQSVGGTSSTATWQIVYRGFIPSTKAQQIAIVPTGGLQQFTERAPIERPTFQLLIRGASTGSTGLEVKVQGAVDALNFYDGTISGRVYVDIQKQGEAHFLGRDEEERPLYSVNFICMRSRTT